MEQALADFNQIKGDVVEATFGQQIRNYVFAPYKLGQNYYSTFTYIPSLPTNICASHYPIPYTLYILYTVKDTRTGLGTAQVQDVMDGDLDPFVAAYLKHSAGLAVGGVGGDLGGEQIGADDDLD